MSESTSRSFALSANHVGIGVSDLTRSIAFYRDLLGFKVAYERGEVTAEYMPRLVGVPGARLKIVGLEAPGLHLDLIQYLAQNYSIPAHKFYVIGLGKDKPVASNKTDSGRAKNRRVDVRLMTNEVGDQNAQAPAAPSTTAANPR